MRRTNVLEYLDETAQRLPDKIAFEEETETLSFGELKRLCDQISTFLLKKRIVQRPVAVLMEKSVWEPAVFWGIVGAGCCYIPLDPQMPEQRLGMMLAQAAVSVLVCEEKTEELADRLCAGLADGNAAGGAGLAKDNAAGGAGLAEGSVEDGTEDSAGKANPCRRYRWRDMLETPPDYGQLLAARQKALDTDPVHIVYTSGTTGIPKGVVTSHRCILDYTESLTEVLELEESCIFANQAPFYYDACMKELYPTIKLGAKTCIVPKQYFMMPAVLMEYLKEKRVNTLCWAVSALTLLSGLGALEEGELPDLKRVAFAGEVFPSGQFRIWQRRFPQAAFTNLYGPTEATGVCCYYPIRKEITEQEAIPIGFPFPNTEILLVNEAGKADREGEIYVRGTCVAAGYYQDPERTLEVFVQNPLNPFYPEIVYRTGDIARYNADGALLYVSRRDFQIKHMGHRVEPGEIEAALNRMDGVVSTCCLYDREEKRILLFYEGSCTEREAAAFLRNCLPRYMFPEWIRRMERMPLNANKKTDRALLYTLYEQEN